MSSKTRRWMTLGIVVLAALIAGGLWRAGSTKDESVGGGERGPSTSVLPRLRSVGTDQAPVAPTGAAAPTPIEPVVAPPIAGLPPARAAAEPPPAPVTEAELAPGAGPGERLMARYEGRSGRLPQAASFEERHGLTRQAAADAPIEIWLSRRHLDPEETVTVFIEALDPAVTIQAATAEMRAGAVVKRWPMTTSAQGRILSAELEAELAFYGGNPQARPPRAGPIFADVTVLAQVQSKEQGVREVRLSAVVALQDSGARLLLGTERVALSDAGNVELSIEVDVRKPDGYYIYAELWSPQLGKSIAFGRMSLGRLAPGRQRVGLIFGGQVIRERGIDGPYAVRNVELLRVGAEPPHMAPPVAELLTTPAWKATAFH